MSMSDTNSDDFFSFTVCEIRDRRIDTELILVGKLEAHIDDDHLIFVLESHTVETYLFSSTEWYDTQGFFFKWLCSLFWDMEELLECLLRREEWV
jgi:hypothetical protein